MVLAAGFDGTLARDGRCDERCIEVLRELSATGRKLILVTGRELRRLLEIFPEARLFDYIVAENGAVLHRTATRQSEILGQAPPEILLQELRRRQVTPLRVGSSIISTAAKYFEVAREALRKLKLHMDYELVTNDDTLLILPPGIDKASGMNEALRELGVSRHNLVAIGNAENDLPLLASAEHAVVVNNAAESIKEAADRVTQGEYCEGFLELARDLIATDLAASVPRRRVVLGKGEDQREILLSPCQDSVLVSGPDEAARSLICNRLLDQLMQQDYQCCVIGADRNVPFAASRSSFADMSSWGDAHDAPRLTDVLTALEPPTHSIEINLAALPPETRPVFVDALLLQLQALHDRAGRPHCILIHHAHHFLTGSQAANAIRRLSEVTMIYSTAEASQLPSAVLNDVKLTIATGQPGVDAPDVAGASTEAQAVIAGGSVCRISLLRPSPGSTSVTSTEEVTVPGF
ncbi:HAD family hydrolase [Peristeroidobacter agariperforans]|uniref:HAD family hydrolase n=1 Tax=Peristeroidobacter agariperforans TaxID=268404 RepID=UPI0018E50789|nr:HAD family hydrolase [Peristeroidobacter agariperforans]